MAKMATRMDNVCWCLVIALALFGASCKFSLALPMPNPMVPDPMLNTAQSESRTILVPEQRVEDTRTTKEEVTETTTIESTMTTFSNMDDSTMAPTTTVTITLNQDGSVMNMFESQDNETRPTESKSNDEAKEIELEKILNIIFCVLLIVAIFMAVNVYLQCAEASFGTELFIAILIAGVGNVIAGMILDTVQNWPVFTNISSLFILVPSIMGLKGNLEMVMASRLSTQANLGRMSEFSTAFPISVGNISVNLSKAGIVSLIAAVLSVVMTVVKKSHFDFKEFIVLTASSVTTATACSMTLGTIMILVIVASHFLKIDPDNVSTPFAASLGDACTLGILSLIASAVYKNAEATTFPWVGVVMIIVVMSLCPLWFLLARKNLWTHDIVFKGWTPVVSALFFSTICGTVLEISQDYYKTSVIFQPIINGVGGNLAVVQASRLATVLHRQGKPGELMEDFKSFSGLKTIFWSDSPTSAASRILLSLTVPVHIIYLTAIKAVNGGGGFQFTAAFFFFYLLFCILQVVLLLFISYNLVHLFWRFGIDPDNSSAPILTALGDLFGTLFLFSCFTVLNSLGDPNAM